MKAVLIVGDGMADNPIPSLNFKTPLEAANIPNLDNIALRGCSGLLDPIDIGVRAGSDTAHLSILGYDPYMGYAGRGPFEAAGAGINLKEGDICFRCNYGTIDSELRFVDRTAGWIRDGTSDLEVALGEIELEESETEAIFKNSLDYRCVLVFRGPGLSPDVTDVDPHALGARLSRSTAVSNDPRATKTAEILNEWVDKAHKVLKEHEINLNRTKDGLPPANAIVPRGAGTKPVLESFEDKYGLKAACIAAVGLIKGIGNLTGMKTINVPGATGYIDSDLTAKAETALKALKTHDFVFLHVEGIDEISHEGNVYKKREMLEKFDSAVGMISEELQEDIMVLLSDHTTSCELKDHTGDPTPITIAGPGVLTDFVKSYDERAVIAGGLRRIRGKNVMPILLDLMNISEKFGA